MERRLAAILAADVVGYSRLMEADEQATLAALAACRKSIDARIAGHFGRIFGSAGDSVIAEFASPVEAARCAVAIQQDLANGDGDLPGGEQMRFRIGVNLGDVASDGDNLLGNGVNIAARLEEIAEPGGICLSGTVQDHLAGTLDLVLEDAGEQKLKNISRPVRVWRWSPERAVAPQVEDGSPKPCIAVLPFENMSGDPEQAYFSDGLTEDIITALSKHRWLDVVARNTTFAYKGRSPDIRKLAAELGADYVVEGSVRRAGKRIRVTAQLIDTGTGSHIWAERYDRDLEDIFEVQDEITGNIVGQVEPEIGTVIRQKVQRAPRRDLHAWDCYHLGIANFYKFTARGNLEAQRLLQQDYTANESQISQLMLANSRIVNESEAMDEETDAAFADLQRQVDDRKAWLDLGLGALQTAAPGLGSVVQGMVPLLAVSLLGGAVYDNRRKDRVIKNGKAR